jgi:hypothetical protein
MAEGYKPNYMALWSKVQRDVKGLTNGDVVAIYGVRMFWAVHIGRFDMFKDAVDERLKDIEQNLIAT